MGFFKDLFKQQISLTIIKTDTANGVTVYSCVGDRDNYNTIGLDLAHDVLWMNGLESGKILQPLDPNVFCKGKCKPYLIRDIESGKEWLYKFGQKMIFIEKWEGTRGL
jgi:hypothetical protein